MRITCDTTIIGSGFAGSLLAWILAKSGQQVMLIDRQQHPRFAIGESSTPVANLLLELIADERQIPELKQISRWGPWRRQLPQLRCGKKRGFSYFSHSPGQVFVESDVHERSLLVAASASDEVSDTQWMRSDVDAWFAAQSQRAGAKLLAPASIQSIRGNQSTGWKLTLEQPECSDGRSESRSLTSQGPTEIHCKWLVDSAGGASPLARELGIGSDRHELSVNTSALFGHFRGVGKVVDWFESQADRNGQSYQQPFSADDAAQHHMLDQGWVWMLRFDDGTTSVGWVRPNVLPSSDWNLSSACSDSTSQWKAWLRLQDRYPMLGDLLRDAELIDPRQGGVPKLGWIPRISRIRDLAAGPHWLLLPAAAGLVDPLHSTGIGHAISGVRRAARLILMDADDTAMQAYSDTILAEIRWIDRIVACCYRALQDSFELFAATCSLYFVAAIHCERELARTGQMQQGFLQTENGDLQAVGDWLFQALGKLLDSSERGTNRQRLIAELQNRLQPWNDVGLMDPALRNRIARSTSPVLDPGC
ncbi:MAG: NAD(P)-binding protein [bacterium]|nr:NAD(P)-binding protein [bacterium]